MRHNKIPQTGRKKQTGVLFCLLLSAALLFCGCSVVKLQTKEMKEQCIVVEEVSLSKAEAVFFLMEEKLVYEDGQDAAAFWQRSIGSESMSDYVKDVSAQQLIVYAAAAVMSDRLAAYPTEEEKKQAAEEAVAAWTKISGLFDTQAYGITAADVNDLYEKKAVYNAVYRKVTADATAEITEDSTRVIKANYVCVPQSAGEEAALSVYRHIGAGSPFADACADAGFSLLTAQVVKRGELNSAVEQVAFALQDGEISEVITGKDGYYIVECIDDHLLMESQANYNAVMTEAKEGAFADAYDAFSQDAALYFDQAFWKTIEMGNIK